MIVEVKQLSSNEDQFLIERGVKKIENKMFWFMRILRLILKHQRFQIELFFLFQPRDVLTAVRLQELISAASSAFSERCFNCNKSRPYIIYPMLTDIPYIVVSQYTVVPQYTVKKNRWPVIASSVVLSSLIYISEYLYLLRLLRDKVFSFINDYFKPHLMQS